VLERFDALVMREAADDGAEPLHFPPIVARTLIERLGYLGNFPQLVGSIHSFFGDEKTARELAALADAGQRWEHLLEPAETMLLPAACYPVYPLFTGLLPNQGRLVTTINWVFRHEPSDEPTRLQAFRVREIIRAGTNEQVVQWRDQWCERSLKMFVEDFLLPARSDVANDPFFGRVGRMMAANQLDQKLKFEILCPVVSLENPTAVCSFNWHQDKFTSTFGIKKADGELASTACLGFGLERVVLAIFKTHGLDPKQWPQQVRSQLWS